MELTFAEQVKILLKRRKMTIKDLADLIEVQTGKKMSRQNLTQQLGRDNFQEKDMRMIAGVLGCAMQIAIISDDLGTDGQVSYVPPMEYGAVPVTGSRTMAFLPVMERQAGHRRRRLPRPGTARW